MDRFVTEAQRLRGIMYDSGDGIEDGEWVRVIAKALRKEANVAGEQRLRTILDSMSAHYGAETVRGKLVRDIIRRANS